MLMVNIYWPMWTKHRVFDLMYFDLKSWISGISNCLTQFQNTQHVNGKSLSSLIISSLTILCILLSSFSATLVKSTGGADKTVMKSHGQLFCFIKLNYTSIDVVFLAQQQQQHADSQTDRRTHRVDVTDEDKHWDKTCMNTNRLKN